METPTETCRALQCISDFPHDILRDIFEIAARKHNSIAVRLLQVSSGVRSWVDPIIFESLSFHASKTSDKGLLDALKRKSPEFRANNVKTVFIHDGALPFANHILSLCQGITNLVSYTELPATLFSSHTQLRRLGASFSNITPITGCAGYGRMDFSTLVNLTHLEVFDPIHTYSDFPESLKMLPQLTHLALNCWLEDWMMGMREMLPVFQSQPQLQMLVLLLHIERRKDESYDQLLSNLLGELAGQGVVTILGQKTYDDWTDWLGGEDVWSRASRPPAERLA